MLIYGRAALLKMPARELFACKNALRCVNNSADVARAENMENKANALGFVSVFFFVWRSSVVLDFSGLRTNCPSTGKGEAILSNGKWNESKVVM